MPNYVKNVIEFTGDKEKINSFFNFIKTKKCDFDEYYFDFNKLIPMPESLEIEDSLNTQTAYYIYCKINGFKPYTPETISFNELNVKKRLESENYEWNIEGIESYIRNQNYDVLGLGKVAYSNFEKHGCFTYYDWRINNWDTKWNSCNSEFDEINGIITFSTAWSFPETIAKKLAELFPELDFTWTFTGEAIGIEAGRCIGKNKKLYIFYPDNESSESYEYYIFCWGECDCIYQDQNGEFLRYSCDQCPHDCCNKE